MQSIMHMNSLPVQQRGATLVVALLLLLIISMVGVSTMRNASTVEKISSADYQKGITFQASESAVQVSLNNRNLFSQAIATGTPITTPNVAINSDVANASVIYMSLGSGPVLGDSLNSVAAERLMITSTSSLAANPNVQTRTVHGLTQKRPNLN